LDSHSLSFISSSSHIQIFIFSSILAGAQLGRFLQYLLVVKCELINSALVNYFANFADGVCFSLNAELLPGRFDLVE
jgi:hypothetical protein